MTQMYDYIFSHATIFVVIFKESKDFKYFKDFLEGRNFANLLINIYFCGV